jgi:hypothetical protein
VIRRLNWEITEVISGLRRWSRKSGNRKGHLLAHS